ncbi:anaerobic ribonucleoside-triphosphate reductase activating protein [Microbulbifer sp. 2205BS26-8]|uniref:anaerobic ribonucleoside-triphosphate reductase activating protein n=1 Tax=Microbulbifer sp. 2205BS26-8 TaxID=3064386 RepID=UPI00273D7F71|nr:anaerobic ribonucleoside-triphosphate reductase activating protein [Microbulbifer sp. 2205BS26-8]MDP5208947.1 anaerobic ribonucleoside-triphosphate reductase activating protein [Microbulbifer sp. 2205BS26-8]
MNAHLQVGGFTPFTAIDYPGELAAVVFCQGCPWRCRYCHNSDLLPARAPSAYDWDQLLGFLADRRGLLDAVVFSGGEPTAQEALEGAVTGVRKLGFKVGLHTAGIYPRRLRRLIPRLDWVGLDIKALPENYPAISGVAHSGATPWQCAKFLAEAGIPLQVRLTRHSRLTSDSELDQIRQKLQLLGISRLEIQHCNSAQALDQTLQFQE